MAITLSKAIEIHELNLKVAGKSMPADCRDALQLTLEAAKEFKLWRATHAEPDDPLLPNEAPEPPPRLPL